MYYYGYFRNTDTTKDKKGQLYKVVIITDFQNQGWTKKGGELKLNSNPFVVTYSGADDNLFKPYKCSTATVSFYLAKINKDLYSIRGNDIYVALLKLKDGVKFVEHDFISGSLNYPCTYDYKEYSLEWVGFATPNAYNQAFVSDFDLYELEAQDALSTLQYYNYKPCGDSITVNTLGDIVKNIVASLGVYKNIFVTDSLKSPVSDYDNQNILNYLYINERNFYNEDDEPLKMLSVLEKILQYLSLTAIPFGNSLYIVDYNAIANGVNTYHQITFENSIISSLHWNNSKSLDCYKDKGTIEIEHTHNIAVNDIAANNINYSLSSTYNKVKVTDDFYFTSNNDIYNNLINPKVYTTVGDFVDYSVPVSNYLFTLINANNQKCYINYYGYNNSDELEIKTYWYSRYYRHGNANAPFTFDVIDTVNSSCNWNYNTAREYVGCVLAKYDVLDNTDNSTPQLESAILFPSLENDNLITYSFFAAEETTLQNMVDFTLKNQLIHSDDYVLINGDLIFYNNTFALPIDESVANTEFKAEHCYLWAKLECNGMYWNGLEWNTTETVFKIPLQYKNNSNPFNTVYPIKSNVGFDNNIPKFGYGIKLPIEEGAFTSDIKLTLMRIWGVDKDKMSRLTVLKNFRFEIISPVKELINNNNTSNTEYTNTVNNSALEEYPNVSLDLTTYCGKDKDYSTVYAHTEYHPHKDNRYRLNVLHNIATGNLMSAEEHIISNICKQYATPNIILEIPLHAEIKPYSLITYKYFDGSRFVVDGITIEYADNIRTVKLVEKLTKNKVTDFERKSKKRDYQRNGDIINDANKAKKDGEVVKHPITLGNSEYSQDNVVWLTSTGGINLTDLDLNIENLYGYSYTWFNINSDGELIMYRPNILSLIDGDVTDSGLLELNINDSIIIL